MLHVLLTNNSKRISNMCRANNFSVTDDDDALLKINTHLFGNYAYFFTQMQHFYSFLRENINQPDSCSPIVGVWRW